MAWFEADIFKKCVEVDLHKYSTRTALMAAREKIKEAYEHGFRHVKLIHGAANITNKDEGASIKFALRTMLKSGQLDKWIGRNGSRVRDGSMILEIRKNPVAVEREWEEMPMEDY
ncbi:MAG: Smr/MutS family protein [Candidatus Methanoperedens sp.]|nr:Smr/MutS family protein [Candidatus Methanoperedens sp.]